MKNKGFPKNQNLEYHLQMPVNWDENIFAEKKMTFYNVTYHCVDKIPQQVISQYQKLMILELSKDNTKIEKFQETKLKYRQLQ